MSSGKLIAVCIFGSVGRRQQDTLSDLDILAVVQDGHGKVPESTVDALIPADLRNLKLSISWYGARRLREMWQNGELFAWHLHRESIPLFDPERLLPGLGMPAAYSEWIADVRSFKAIFDGIPNQVANNRCNAIYEAGLIYVCLRNIAMAASWVLCRQPNFSRHSAFDLGGIRPCPISIREFDTTMHCRMASQRGTAPPADVDYRSVLDLFDRLEPWLRDLQLTLPERKDGRQHPA